MRQLVALSLTLVLLTSGLAGTALVAGQSAESTFDRTEYHITVYDNGTAKWTFTYKQTLTNESDRQQFRQFAAAVNNNSTSLAQTFPQRAAQLAAAGEATTGRNMTATHISRRAYVGGLVNNKLGIVKLSFHWTNFATTTGETVTIGDAFEGGLYIGPNQSLIVESGPNLTITSATPSVDAMAGDSLSTSESITWRGERAFTDQRPRVTFTHAAPPATPTSTPTTGPVDGTSFPTPTTLAIIALLVGLGGALVVGYRRRARGQTTAAASVDETSGPHDDASADTANDTDPDADTAGSDYLLSDEERVTRLLKENGGRMKQASIVEEVDWSKSKVSLLLSEMEDEGTITKHQLGRENIVSLDGHEPDETGSPFDDNDA